MMLKIIRGSGIIEKEETYNQPTLKMKIITILVEMVYLVFTIIPISYIYTSFNISCVYITSIFLLSIWIGEYNFILDLGKKDISEARNLDQQCTRKQVNGSEKRIKYSSEEFVINNDGPVPNILESETVIESEEDNSSNSEKSWEEISTNL